MHHPQILVKKILHKMQINSRLIIGILILKVIFVIFFIVIASKNTLNNDNEMKHTATAFHKLVNLFKERNKIMVGSNKDDGDNSTLSSVDADELIWSNETVELFQDQLGLTLLMMNKSDDETKIKCENEFMLCALPSAEEENFYEALWQFFSLDAMERVIIICDDSGKKLTLRAVVTERIKNQWEKVFEGLSNFCYNITYFPSISIISLSPDLSSYTILLHCQIHT